METIEGKHGNLIQIERMEAMVSVEEYVKTCVDVPKFLSYCKECPSYGNRWSCPPFEKDPVTIWEQYETVRLYGYVLPNGSGQSVAGALENMEQAKDQLLKELLELEQAIPGSFVLSCGTCRLCRDNCTRPAGKPCRMPEKMRHSVESLGGDVSKTAELYLKKPMLWIKDSVLPDYLMLVGGLLLKRQED